MKSTLPYTIIPTDRGDLETIFTFFRAAIAYQEKNGFECWPLFDREMILQEMTENRQWKITIDGEITYVFSVQYNDAVIWGERDADPSVYLHRIVVNPIHKGKGMMKPIREWAIQHAREKNKRFVRMDTWGNNINIRAYYTRCGFPYVGQQQLEELPGGPQHYGGTCLSLFEIEV